MQHNIPHWMKHDGLRAVNRTDSVTTSHTGAETNMADQALWMIFARGNALKTDNCHDANFVVISSTGGFLMTTTVAKNDDKVGTSDVAS